MTHSNANENYDADLEAVITELEHGWMWGREPLEAGPFWGELPLGYIMQESTDEELDEYMVSGSEEERRAARQEKLDRSLNGFAFDTSEEG